MEHLPSGDVCPHGFDEESFKVPRHTDTVCHDECAYCCQTSSHHGGIFVCAKCFVGTCPAHIEKHMQLEPSHTTFVRIEVSTQYPEKKPKLTDASQLGAVAPKQTTIRCYCGECGVNFSLESDFQIAASASATAIAHAAVPANDAQVSADAAWGAPTTCAHTNASLEQVANEKYGPGKAVPTEKEKCNFCDVAKNNWMCLTCGHIGCPRKTAGGNEHAVFHFMMTNHPLVVKLGTVTPVRADIHCYICEKEISSYPELAQHLAHFGIQQATAVKTAKSLAEMELDQSLKHEYAAIQEEGAKLKPLFGPGLTGLYNFGNSCYIASILQVLIGTEPFARRFANSNHIATCTRKQPLNCIECQLERLVKGMVSGRYSIAPPPKQQSLSQDGGNGDDENEETSDGEDTTNQQQESGGGAKKSTPRESYREKMLREDYNTIAPKLLKALVAGTNSEWKSKDQQDADEYFWHVMDTLRSSLPTQNGEINAGQHFEFLEETRRSCAHCGAVRYDYSRAHSLRLNLPVANPPPPLDPNVKHSDAELEARRVTVDFDAMARSYLEKSSFDATCPHCHTKSTLTETHRLATFPDFLAIKARREYYDRTTQSVRKLDARVVMPEHLDLSAFVGTGFQQGKETWLSQEVGSGQGRQQQQSAAAGPVKVDPDMVALLMSMDFPENKAKWALFKTKNDPDAAIGYICEHDNEPSESDMQTLQADSQAGAPQPNQQQQQQAPQAGAVDQPILPPTSTVGTNGPPSGYELYAMASHMGQNAHVGHWIAHVKVPGHGWVIFNDSKVAASQKPPFTHATMYFYRRVRKD